MRGGGREPTSLELALWRHAMRDVRRLDGDEEEPTPSPPVVAPAPAAPPEPAPSIAKAPRRAPPQPPPPPLTPGQIDRRVFQRLQKGRYPISARLDLHGMTLDAAHGALVSFILREQRRGTRCALVITGRGRHSEGVIKTMTPRWLSTPPLAERVLSYATARVAHGGEGALYVMLRRPR